MQPYSQVSFLDHESLPMAVYTHGTIRFWFLTKATPFSHLSLSSKFQYHLRSPCQRKHSRPWWWSPLCSSKPTTVSSYVASIGLIISVWLEQLTYCGNSDSTSVFSKKSSTTLVLASASPASWASPLSSSIRKASLHTPNTTATSAIREWMILAMEKLTDVVFGRFRKILEDLRLFRDGCGMHAMLRVSQDGTIWNMSFWNVSGYRNVKYGLQMILLPGWWHPMTCKYRLDSCHEDP